MSVLQTILIYVVIPLAGYGLIVLLASGRKPGGARYRPGVDWNYPPVWWSANPAALPATHGEHVGEASVQAGRTARGGARGRW